MSLAPLSPRAGSRPDSRSRSSEAGSGDLGAFESLLARSTAEPARASGPRGGHADAVPRAEHPAGSAPTHPGDGPRRPMDHPAAADARPRAGRGHGHGPEHGVDAPRQVGGHRADSGADDGTREAAASSDALTGAPSTAASPATLLAAGAPPAGSVAAPLVLAAGGDVTGAGEAAPAPADSRGAKAMALAGPTGLGGFLARTTAGRPGSGEAAAATATAPATAPAPAPVPGGATGTSAPATRGAAPGQGVPAGDGTPATRHGAHPAKPSAAAATATTTATTTATATGQAVAGQAPRAGARSSSRSGAEHDGPAAVGGPGDTTPGNIAAGGAPAPAPGARVGETAGPQQAQPSANPVLDQVLTVVPRLVQRGDGTSRLTLKLHPADLGEVHVTVTVKGGTVDVTLAAGSRAKEALGAGCDRLRTLLESLGHTSGQVVVRDLAGVAAAGSSSPSGQSWGQPGQQPDQQSQQPAPQGDASFAGPGGAPGDGNRSGADGDPGRRLPDTAPVAQADDVDGTARADLGPRRAGRPGSTGRPGLDVTI